LACAKNVPVGETDSPGITIDFCLLGIGVSKSFVEKITNTKCFSWRDRAGKVMAFFNVSKIRHRGVQKRG
jgi:hypothetical protein